MSWSKDYVKKKIQDDELRRTEIVIVRTPRRVGGALLLLH